MTDPTPITTGTATTGKIGSLAIWRRPRSYWDVTVLHLPLTLIFGTALLLPYLAALTQLPLMRCTFLHFTGYPCPLCGFTRAFWAIANGQWSLAMANCPLAFMVVLFCAVMFVWHFSAVLFGVVLSRGPALRPAPARRRTITATLLVLLTLNWIYRLSSGLA